jgi:hypothetical protein
VAKKMNATAYFFCFFLFHYAIDVYALVSCLFIVMYCLFIVMVENADDDPGETKQILVENSGDVKPTKVEAKPNIDRASDHVKASLYVDSGIVPLDANEVDTTHFFPKYLNGKIRMICLIGYIVKQIGWDLIFLFIYPI